MSAKDREYCLKSAMTAYLRLKEYILPKEEERLEDRISTISTYIGFTKQQLKDYLIDIEDNY